MKTLATSLWLTSLALLSTAAYGQSKLPVKQPAVADGPALRTYQGEYEGGRATYTYYLNKAGERVRHGHFVSTRTEQGGSSFSSIRGGVSRLATIGTSSYQFDHRTEGDYAEGQRTGRWTTTQTTVSTTNSLRTGPVKTIERRITSSQTYQNGQPNGPASYTDVPWHGGKPGTPTEAASACRRTQPTAYQLRETTDGQADTEAIPRDTTITTTEYAAGPFRYEAAPALSDPARRPQSVRGRFDAAGYCDSTWTLRYWKSGSELDEASEVQQAQGWMTTMLEFSHGLLRRERTTQASTGEVIHQFAGPQAPTARLRLVGTPTHLYDFSPSDINRPETPDADWQSPLPADEDASRSFFVDATRPLGPPRLLDGSYRLVPTAADSALLAQCEPTLTQARAHWQTLRGRPARPETDTTGQAFRALYLGLYNLLAARQAEPAGANEPTEKFLFGAREAALQEQQRTARTADNLYPWLRKLTGTDAEPTDADAASQATLLAQLGRIRQQLALVQGQLNAPTLPATGQLGNAQP